MPVRESMSIASCEKKPISRIGVLERLLSGSRGSTSKAYPWLVSWVSSQVIQVPHGVPPPAQLFSVPEDET